MWMEAYYYRNRRYAFSFFFSPLIVRCQNKCDNICSTINNDISWKCWAPLELVYLPISRDNFTMISRTRLLVLGYGTNVGRFAQTNLLCSHVCGEKKRVWSSSSGELRKQARTTPSCVALLMIVLTGCCWPVEGLCRKSVKRRSGRFMSVHMFTLYRPCRVGPTGTQGHDQILAYK